jgi:hypothetical protein
MRKSHRMHAMHEGFMKASWQQLMAGDACSYMFILFISWHNWHQHINSPQLTRHLGRAMAPWCHGHELPWTAMTWLGRISVFPCFSTSSRSSRSSNCGRGISADLRCQSSSCLLSDILWHRSGSVNVTQCDTFAFWSFLLTFAYFCLLLLTFAFCFVAK